MARISKSEKLKRVRTVQEYLLRGEDSIDIIQSITVTWGICERMAYRYLKAAREEMQKAVQYDLGQRIAWHIKARERLIKKWGDKDPAIALKLLDSLSNYEEKMGTMRPVEEKREKAQFKMPDGSILEF